MNLFLMLWHWVQSLSICFLSDWFVDRLRCWELVNLFLRRVIGEWHDGIGRD